MPPFMRPPSRLLSKIEFSHLNAYLMVPVGNLAILKRARR
jgi:hypothetical protein